MALVYFSVGDHNKLVKVTIGVTYLPYAWYLLILVKISIAQPEDQPAVNARDRKLRVRISESPFGFLYQNLTIKRVAQWIAFSLCTQRPRVRFLAFPRIFSEELFILDVAKNNWLLNSGQQRLNNLDRTHLALWLSGKLVLQKRTKIWNFSIHFAKRYVETKKLKQNFPEDLLFLFWKFLSASKQQKTNLLLFKNRKRFQIFDSELIGCQEIKHFDFF